MIFLIVTRDSNIKNGALLNEKCPKCKIENALNFSIYKRYTYLTLIPLFPVGKLLTVQCSNCKELFDYEDLSGEIQEKLKNQKIQNPIWMFSGSIILVLFLIFTINGYFQNKNETSILIKNPIKGDIYNLKISNGYYSNMKIEKVTADSIYIVDNDFKAYMPYDVDDLDKPENYTNQKKSYSKKDILRLYEDNQILKISRKRNDL
jgi:phage FluMu protein Com